MATTNLRFIRTHPLGTTGATTNNVYVGGVYVGSVRRGAPQGGKRHAWHATVAGAGELVREFETLRDAGRALQYIADGEPVETFGGYR